MKTFRQILGAVALCFVASMFTGCELFFDLKDNPISTTLSMPTLELTLYEGQTAVRKATTASPGAITYTSSDTNVATVDAEGNVTAINAGTATITASVAAFDYWLGAEVSYQVRVLPAVPNKTPAAITFAAPMVNKLSLDAAFTITADNTGDANITYTSSSPTVASVDEATGQVTLKGTGHSGTVTITATVADTDDYVYAEKQTSYSLVVTDSYAYQVYDPSTNNLKTQVVSADDCQELTSNAGNVTLDGSKKYIVRGDNVVIGGTLTFSSNADLILFDNAVITVKKISSGDNTLNIYAQSEGTQKGQLYAGPLENEHGIYGNNLNIHGGYIEAWSCNSAFYIDNCLNIYGGEIEAHGTYSSTYDLAGCAFFVKHIVVRRNAVVNATGGTGWDTGHYAIGINNPGSFSIYDNASITATGGHGYLNSGYALSGPMDFYGGTFSFVGCDYASYSSAVSTTWDITNKSGSSVTFQYKTSGGDWTNAGSTANNADFANSDSYVGVRKQ